MQMDKWRGRQAVRQAVRQADMTSLIVNFFNITKAPKNKKRQCMEMWPAAV